MRCDRGGHFVHAAYAASAFPQIVWIVLVLDRIIVDSGEHGEMHHRPGRDALAEVEDVGGVGDSAGPNFAFERIDEAPLPGREGPAPIRMSGPVSSAAV